MDLPLVEKILSEKYPAKQHAHAVASYLTKALPDSENGVIFLEGQKSKLYEDCDQEVPFRQRRSFFYLTGLNEPDSYVIYNIASKKLTLYIPPIDPESVVWSGLPLTPDEAKTIYDVDDVHLTSDLSTDFEKIASASHSEIPVFLIPAQTNLENLGKVVSSADANLYPDKSGILEEAIDECRAIKDTYEVALIKKANYITAEAHHAVLRTVKTAKNEQELAAVFTKTCIEKGAHKQAYGGIFGSGRAAATLHYVHNNKPLEGKLNVLADAGAEIDCYAADVTRTFPISGKFSKESQEIYNIVLSMQKAALAESKPGKDWDEIHMLVHKIAIEGLLKIGILKGGSVDEIMEARTSTAFLPHGLGHMLGMNTHDTGGHPNYSDPDKMFCYLRKRGPLKAGHCITVEPGLYFCEFIIKPYLSDPKHSKYIDEKVLEKYWDVGGVRIEDDILITDDGYENLTTAVKESDEMLAMINGS